MNIINTAAATIATGDLNWPSITTTMKTNLEHALAIPQRNLLVKNFTRKQNRSWWAVTKAQLDVSKQVFDLLVLLVHSKLKSSVAINTQPWLYNCKEVEIKANHRH